MNGGERFDADAREVVSLLGSYAVGSLDGDERAEAEEALASSELARMLYRDVAEAAAALGEADPAHIDDRDEPPLELQQRILAAAAHRRPARRTAITAAAACVVALTGGLVVVGAQGDPSPEPPPRASREAVSFPAGADGAEVVSADLIAQAWGTKLEIIVDGVAEGVTYTVFYLDASGEPVDAGSFLGVDGPPVSCHFHTALLREDITGLVVRDPTGAIVLETDLV